MCISRAIAPFYPSNFDQLSYYLAMYDLIGAFHARSPMRVVPPNLRKRIEQRMQKRRRFTQIEPLEKRLADDVVCGRRHEASHRASSVSA